MKTLPVLFLAAALSAHAQIGSAITFDVVPDEAAPRTPISLWLLSESFSCASRFSNLVVTVDSIIGGRPPSVTLSYLDTLDPAVRCTASPGAVYGPKFQIPGLRADVYDVIANPKQRCQVQPPFCAIPEVYVNAGTLRVWTGGGGWFLKPKTVQANMAFDLEILDEVYGNCNYGFSNTVFLSSGAQRRINTASLMEYVPGRLCLIDIHPHGPTFSVSGLAAGVYQVFYRERDSCEVQNPSCPVTSPNMLVDTLTVLAPLPVRPGLMPRRPAYGKMIQGYRADGRKAAMLEKARLR